MGRELNNGILGRGTSKKLMGSQTDRITECQRAKQIDRYNEHAKDLVNLENKDVVRVQNEKGIWDQKAIVEKQVGPRSYEVLTERGSKLRRNRRDLLKVRGDCIIDTTEPEYVDGNENVITEGRNVIETLENIVHVNREPRALLYEPPRLSENVRADVNPQNITVKGGQEVVNQPHFSKSGVMSTGGVSRSGRHIRPKNMDA